MNSIGTTIGTVVWGITINKAIGIGIGRIIEIISDGIGPIIGKISQIRGETIIIESDDASGEIIGRLVAQQISITGDIIIKGIDIGKESIIGVHRGTISFAPGAADSKPATVALATVSFIKG